MAASKKTASKKTASKKTTSKETASKKTASKKTATKKTAAEKTATEKGNGAGNSSQPEKAPAKRSPFAGLQEGRIVHYRHAISGKTRPAIVVEVVDLKAGTCDLTVFCSRSEVYASQPPVLHVRGIAYSARPEKNTWCWPPRA